MIDPVATMTAVLSDLQSLAGAASAPPDAGEALGAGAVGGAEATSPTFAQALQTALAGVDNSISQANGAARGFSAGDDSIPLSDVMIALENANLSLQLASGVRDKVVAAYSNVMNMQV
jgi:flagellar hook-basal body complex protein FliE